MPIVSGNGLGLSGDSDWSERDFTAPSRSSALGPPKHMRLHTHTPAGTDRCLASSVLLLAPPSLTYLYSYRQMLYGDRLRDKDTRIPVADTPAQQRCVGDQDNSGAAGKASSALVFERPFQWFGSLLHVSCFFKTWWTDGLHHCGGEGRGALR